MLRVGITGGIGGGKSVFSQIIRDKGFLVYDTDFEAKKLQNENADIRNRIEILFGEKSYTNNMLNRKFIANQVFSDINKLNDLNQIVHPAVKKHLLNWYENHQNEKLLFVECAILFEGGFNELTDINVLITASEEIRIQRVMLRDNTSREQVKNRIHNQMPDNLKFDKVDFIFNTDNGIDIARINSFLMKILNLS